MQFLSRLWSSFLSHPLIASVRTSSVWILVVPAAVLLCLTDLSFVETMVQWASFSLVLAGVAIMVSMVVLPQLNLTDLVDLAKGGSIPAAIMVAALVLFLGILFYTLIFWAKT